MNYSSLKPMAGNWKFFVISFARRDSQTHPRNCPSEEVSELSSRKDVLNKTRILRAVEAQDVPAFEPFN